MVQQKLLSFPRQAQSTCQRGDRRAQSNETTDDYVTTNQATGPKITSSIAGAARIFWNRPLKQVSLKMKLDPAAITINL